MKGASMKITYVWYTFTVAEAVLALLPHKAKTYVKKWADLKSDIVKSIRVSNSMSRDAPIEVILELDVKNYSAAPNPLLAKGISFRDAWENLLDVIAKLENMKNAEELCIWLDMKTQA